MGKFVIRKTATGIKFDLKAVNGEVIATSEVYTSEDACRNGIASVKKNAPIAGVEDQTAKDFSPEKHPVWGHWLKAVAIQGHTHEYLKHPVWGCVG